MSTHLYHFLTLSGKVAKDAAQELARFREFVTDPDDRDDNGYFPEFTRFCQRLLSTRFEPPAIHYSCFRNDVGIGNLGIRGFADQVCGTNAVRDLQWAATVYPDTCAEACLAVAQSRRDENAAKILPYETFWLEDMLTTAIGAGLLWRLPFDTFLVIEQVGMTVFRDEIIQSSSVSFNDLVEGAQANAVYLPITARVYDEPA